MKKNIYTAPELELLSTMVECGFNVSGFSTIEEAAENLYEDEF